MNNNELRKWYLALRDPDKLLFLGLVSHDLTIHGRELGLHPPEERQRRAFLGLNELQHQISGQIVGIASGQDHYPDDVLWTVLAEEAAAYSLTTLLERSLQFAGSRNLWGRRDR
jgi:hypothetical protein